MYPLAELSPEVANNPYLTPVKRFILEIARDLPGFHGLLEHFNNDLLENVEGHFIFNTRQRNSLLKLLRENGKTLGGLEMLRNTARFDIPGFRPSAKTYFGTIRRNFKQIEDNITAAESNTSFSTKERFGALMYQLKRRSDWHLVRFLIHDDAEYRKIYRSLFAISTKKAEHKSEKIRVASTRPAAALSCEEDLECIICHENALHDPCIPVYREVSGKIRLKARLEEQEEEAKAASSKGNVSDSAEGDTEEDEEVWRILDQLDFAMHGGLEEEDDDVEEEAESAGASADPGAEIGPPIEPDEDDQAPFMSATTTRGGSGKVKGIQAADVKVAQTESRRAADDAEKVPGYGLTLCCKKPYHPFCLIPWTDRSNTCPMCRKDWENLFDFQIEMHELRIDQVEQQITEWDVEDLIDEAKSSK